MKLYKAITPLVIAAFLFQDVAWARPYNSLRPLPAADRTELATTIQHQATAEPSVIITPPVQFTGLKPADASGLITEISTAIHNGGFADFDTDLLTKLCAKITDRIGNLNRFQEQVQAALANKGIRVYITDDYQAPFTLVPDNEGNSVVAINAGLFRQFHSAGLAELLVAVGVFYDGMCQIVDNGPRPELPDEDANIMARIARSLLEGEPGLQVLSPENLRAVANTLSAEPAFVEFGDALTFEVLGPGSMLDKRYKIKKELGKGGFGVVYLANDEELAGMEVAVKCFRNINEMSETDRKRLERELAAMARFQNCPSIVGVRGVKRHKRTKAPLYLVMDFVPGKPLSNYVPEPGAPRTAEHLTQQEAVLAALKVARGLAVMHKAGFIHRDIKEANVMIDLDRHGSILEATILDLGLTRPIGDTTLDEAKPQSTVEHEAAQNVTDGRWVMGTPFYMSPEQEQGFTKELKPASDVYACAVMLYRMLTGERVVNPQMPGIDPELRPILRKALALAWDGQPPDYRVAAHQTEADGTTTLIRYKDAAEFGKALQAYYDRKFGNARQLKPRVAIAAQPPLQQQPAKPTAPKQKMGKKTAAIIAGAVAAVGAGVIGYHMLKPGESVAPVPEQPATTAAQPAVTPAPAAAGQATAETGQDGRLHYPLTRETRLGDQPISLFGTDLRLSRDGTYREPFLPDLRGIIKAIPAEPGTPGGQPHYFLMTTEPGGKYDGAAGYANRGPHNPIVLTAEELKKHQAIIVTYYARLTPGSKKAQTGFYCTAGEENLALSNVNIKESASLTADEHGYSWQRIDKVIPTSKLETLLNSSGVCRLYTVTVIAGTALPDAVHITPPILRWALQDEATGIYTVSKEETTSRAPAVAPAAAGQAQGAMLPLLKAKLMGNGKDGHAYYELGKEVGMGVDEKGNVVKGEIKAVGFAANDKRPQATGPDYYFEIQNPTEGDFNAGRFNIGGAVVRSLAESIKGGSVYKIEFWFRKISGKDPSFRVILPFHERSGGPQIVVSKELTFDKNSGDWTFGRFVFAAPAGSPELEYVAFAADGGVGGLYYPTFGPANASEITQYRAEVFQLFEIRPTGNAAEPYQFKDVIFREGPGIKLKVGMQDGQLAVTIVSPSSDDKKVACFGTTGASKRDEISQALNIKSGGKYKLTMRLRLDEIKNPCVYGGATFSIPGTENGKQALSGDAKIYGRKGEIVQVQLVFKVPDEIRPADKSIITNTTVRFGEGVYTIIGRPEWSPASDSDVTGYVPAQAQAAPVFTVKSDGKGGFLPVNFELDKRYLKGTSLELIPFARTEDKPNAQVTAPYFIRLISAADSGEGRALITTANYLSDIPVIPGQRYALKLWFKRVTGPATGTVSVLTRYRNSQGKLLSDEEIIRLGARINMRGIPSGRWVQLQFVTTAPPGCKSIGQFMISSGTGEWHACEPVFVSPVKASDETGQDGLKYPLAPEQETRFGDQPIFLFGTGLRLSGDGTYKEPYLPEIRGIIRALAAEPGTPDGQPYYFLMVPEKGGKDSYVAGYANQGSRESIVFTVQELKAHPAGVIVTYYARLAPGSKKASTGFYSYIGAMSLESGGVPKGLSVKLTTDEHGNRWHRIDLVLKPSDLPPPDPSGKYSFYGFAINGFDDATHITRPVLRWARRDEATGAYPISQQAQPAQITPAPNLSQPALTSI